MKMKSVKSVKSVRSVRSQKLSSVFEECFDFAEVIINALKQFECPINVATNKVYKETLPVLGSSKTMKKDKKRAGGYRSPTSVSIHGSDSEVVQETTTGEEGLIITGHYDTTERLVEVSINNYLNEPIPRMVLQVLCFILPSYTKLAKVTIRHCRMNKYTIPEINKIILNHRTITDICLDSSILLEANYDVLLQQVSTLRHLSLSKCNINDELCKIIVSKMHYLQAAETMLLTINLSTNDITDEGAKAIGEALRNNRHLRYLNLSDNRITDDGAGYIFEALKEFPLTYDEIISKREMFMRYLRNKFAVYNKCLQECFDGKTLSDSGDKRSRKKSTTVKSKSITKRYKVSVDEDWIHTKAQLMASELVGRFDHPYSGSQVTKKEGYEYCKGNLILCYLNLAYNNLTYCSVKKLLEVLNWQKTRRSDSSCGLVKVVLDGNNLPECEELEIISSMFRGMTGSATRQSVARMKPIKSTPRH